MDADALAGIPPELWSFVPVGVGPFTPAEVAVAFGWNSQMVHEKCRGGEIVSIGEGKSRRISVLGVLNYLRAEAVKNSPRHESPGSDAVRGATTV